MSVNRTKLNRCTEELKNIFSDYKSSYKCPICLHDFSIEDVDKGKLCDAHIIPKTLGGKRRTIVCTNCDNKIGHEIEGPIKNYLTNLSTIYLKKNGKIYGSSEIIIEGKTFPAQISANKGKGWTIKMLDPNLVEQLFGQIKKAPFKVTALIPKPRKATNQTNTALSLKIAYLAAFEHYGYNYILKNQLNWVRDALRSPQSYKTPYKCSFIIDPYPFKNEYLLIRYSLIGFDTPIFIGKLGKLGTLVLLPPFEQDPNKPFNGYGLENRHQVIITLAEDCHSIISIDFQSRVSESIEKLHR